MPKIQHLDPLFSAKRAGAAPPSAQNAHSKQKTRWWNQPAGRATRDVEIEGSWRLPCSRWRWRKSRKKDFSGTRKSWSQNVLAIYRFYLTLVHVIGNIFPHLYEERHHYSQQEKHDQQQQKEKGENSKRRKWNKTRSAKNASRRVHGNKKNRCGQGGRE